VKATRSKRIGIIGTEGTVRSGVYEQAIKKLMPEATVFSRATGLFVPIVEEGITETKILTPVLNHYLDFFKDKAIDTLILGCTHYPLLRQVLQQHLGEQVTIVDSAQATAQAVHDLLIKGHLESRTEHLEADHLFVTDAPERVAAVAKSFLIDTPVPIVKVSLN
jgi:glutamate racemase